MSGVTNLRPLLKFLLVSVAAGFIVGALWIMIAPHELMKVYGGKAYPETYQPQGFIADDGTLAALLVGVGLIVTITLMMRLPDRPLRVLGLGVSSGLLVGVIAALVGTRLGRTDLAHLAPISADGALLEAPITLRATAVLLLWPLITAALVTSDTLIASVRVSRARRRASAGDVDELAGSGEPQVVGS